MSIKSEKDKMKDRVRKRAERYRKMKEKSVLQKTYVHVVFDFLQEMEKVYTLAKNPDDFKVMMDATTKSLDERMKVFDHYVKLEIHWNECEDWTQLRCTGVTVRWSAGFLSKNPDKQAEEYIDITQCLLEDLGL